MPKRRIDDLGRKFKPRWWVGERGYDTLAEAEKAASTPTLEEAVRRAAYVVECLRSRGDDGADEDADAIEMLIAKAEGG